ncbi:hypothetical protein WDU94_013712 [Cyamophila willieti]
MYRSNETLTDVNSLPYEEASQTESQYVQNLNLQLNLAVQEKEAATEMLKLSQMTLNNLETVMDERRKTSSVDYIKTVKAEYSEAIQLLNKKIESLSKQASNLQEENNQYKALTRDLESDNQLLREKNVELENELSHHIKQAEDIHCRDSSHESIRTTLLAVEHNAKEKEDLQRQLTFKELELTKLSEKCADVESTATQMEEALRNSEAKLKGYRQRETTHLEAIESYVKEINDMKDKVQGLKSKLQDEQIESKKKMFDMQQDMMMKISRLTNENSALQRNNASLQNELSQLSQSADQLTTRLGEFQISTVSRDTYDNVLDQLSEMKQQKLFHQQESARVKNDLECLNNEHILLMKSLTGKVHLLETQLSSLETVLHDSSQHCQMLTEENLEHVQELTLLRSQLYFYHKLYEKNSLLAAVEKCNLLEGETNSRISELNSYVDKYRDQVKSWKDEWQKMAARFKQRLEHLQKENEVLRRENISMRQYQAEGIKCKIKTGDA